MIRYVLELVGLAKSTYYYRRKEKKAEKSNVKRGRKIPGYAIDEEGTSISDEEIVAIIRAHRRLEDSAESEYGYKKLKYFLSSEYKLIVNHKKIYRICKEECLLKKRARGKRISQIVYEKKEVRDSNQLWEIDIKYVWIDGEERFAYVCELIDVFDRNIVGYHIGLNCRAEEISIMVEESFRKRGLKKGEHSLSIRSDNGTQFTSYEFETKLIELGIKHERIPNASPNKNAHIESFHSIMEMTFVRKYYFRTYQELYEKLHEFILKYNYKRIHSGIGYMTPNEYYNLTQEGKIEKKPVAA